MVITAGPVFSGWLELVCDATVRIGGWRVAPLGRLGRAVGRATGAVLTIGSDRGRGRGEVVLGGVVPLWLWCPVGAVGMVGFGCARRWLLLPDVEPGGQRGCRGRSQSRKFGPVSGAKTRAGQGVGPYLVTAVVTRHRTTKGVA